MTKPYRPPLTQADYDYLESLDPTPRAVPVDPTSTGPAEDHLNSVWKPPSRALMRELGPLIGLILCCFSAILMVMLAVRGLR